MFLATKLHSDMDMILLPEQFIGQTVSYRKLSKLLNQILRPLGGYARVTRVKSTDGNNGKYLNKPRTFCILSGYYDTELTRKMCVTVHVSSKRDAILFTRARFNKFRFLFSQIVQHEFIHKSQFSFNHNLEKRNIKVGYSHRLSKKRVEQIEYLSEWFEVDAYAHDIAMEIANNYPSKNPETILKTIDAHRNLPSYSSYKETFVGTEWNRLKASLLRKVWRWVPDAKIPTPV